MSAPHKRGISEYQNNYALMIHGPMELSTVMVIQEPIKNKEVGWMKKKDMRMGGCPPHNTAFILILIPPLSSP